MYDVGFNVQGLRLRGWGLVLGLASNMRKVYQTVVGFRVKGQGLEFRVWGLGSGFKFGGLRFRVYSGLG